MRFKVELFGRALTVGGCWLCLAPWVPSCTRLLLSAWRFLISSHYMFQLGSVTPHLSTHLLLSHI